MPFWRCIQIKGKEKSGNNVLNVNYNKHWELCLFSSFLDTVCVEISSFKYIRKLQEKDHSCVLPAFWALCYKICFLSFHFKIISMNAFNINILLRFFFFFLPAFQLLQQTGDVFRSFLFCYFFHRFSDCFLSTEQSGTFRTIFNKIFFTSFVVIPGNKVAFI